jgi:hypothetical protein
LTIALRGKVETAVAVKMVFKTRREKGDLQGEGVL